MLKLGRKSCGISKMSHTHCSGCMKHIWLSVKAASTTPILLFSMLQHFSDTEKCRHQEEKVTLLYNKISRVKKMDKLPVNALHHYEDFLPGSVSPGLPVNNGLSQKFLKALHV